MFRFFFLFVWFSLFRISFSLYALVAVYCVEGRWKLIRPLTKSLQFLSRLVCAIFSNFLNNNSTFRYIYIHINIAIKVILQVIGDVSFSHIPSTSCCVCVCVWVCPLVSTFSTTIPSYIFYTLYRCVFIIKMKRNKNKGKTLHSSLLYESNSDKIHFGHIIDIWHMHNTLTSRKIKETIEFKAHQTQQLLIVDLQRFPKSIWFEQLKIAHTLNNFFENVSLELDVLYILINPTLR